MSVGLDRARMFRALRAGTEVLDREESELLRELLELRCPDAVGESQAHRWVAVVTRHVEALGCVVEAEACACGASRTRFTTELAPPEQPSIVHVANTGGNVVHAVHGILELEHQVPHLARDDGGRRPYALTACGSTVQLASPMFQFRNCANAGPYSLWVRCDRCSRMAPGNRIRCMSAAGEVYEGLRALARNYADSLERLHGARLLAHLNHASTLGTVEASAEAVARSVTATGAALDALERQERDG